MYVKISSRNKNWANQVLIFTKMLISYPLSLRMTPK